MNSSRLIPLAALPLTVIALSALAPQRASALPKYAQKEKKPCSHCHVNKAGGGKRTEAGNWYGSHNHSFAGYKPAGAAAAKPAKPGKGAKPAKKS